MADFHKVSATNTDNGPRIFTASPPIILQPGASTDGEVQISTAELESMRRFGSFDIEGGPDAAEPGPLGGNVDDLTTHLATVTDADEVQKLLDAETAGKSRKGAVAALEARRDELLA